MTLACQKMEMARQLPVLLGHPATIWDAEVLSKRYRAHTFQHQPEIDRHVDSGPPVILKPGSFFQDGGIGCHEIGLMIRP